MKTQEIKPDLMIHAKGKSSSPGAEGVYVGKVDQVEGERWIKLSKKDSSDGKSHWIPIAWVDHADATTLYLSKTVDDFRRGLLNKSPLPKH